MRCALALFLTVALLIGTPAVAQVAQPEIWFNPHGVTTLDLLNMWTKDAPWQQAAKKVKVLVLVHWWVRKQTDATLRQILDFARANHMEIDLSTEPVSKISNIPCGGEEGYMGVGEIQATVNTLVRLGADVKWVDMDEPVWWGSYSPGPLGCQYSIPVLVNHVADIIKVVVAAYPSVKVMEVEPVTLVQQPNWRQDETTFRILFAQQIGRPIQSLQVDVPWQLPSWKQAMLEWYAYLREQNLKFSVIYNGNATTRNDADWISSTVANFEAVEGELQIIPDQVLFTSWDSYPTYNMPETAPTAQTWLINRYVRSRSHLQVQFVGQGTHGKLTTEDGKPIAGATIKGYKPGVDFTKPLPVEVATGAVPAWATQALIGVRVNTECGGCSGLNDILLGTITYQETQGGSAHGSYTFLTKPGVSNGAVYDGEMVGGTKVSRIISAPGQTMTLNGPAWIPVTANAQYQFSVPSGTIGGLGWFGNVILIFGDTHGNQTRVTVTPGPGKALISTAVTNPDGTFNLPHVPRSVDGPNPVTVEFDGGAGAYRPSIWTPLR